MLALIRKSRFIRRPRATLSRAHDEAVAAWARTVIDEIEVPDVVRLVVPEVRGDVGRRAPAARLHRARDRPRQDARALRHQPAQPGAERPDRARPDASQKAEAQASPVDALRADPRPGGAPAPHDEHQRDGAAHDDPERHAHRRDQAGALARVRSEGRRSGRCPTST